jgi:hypothetical protein
VGEFDVVVKAVLNRRAGGELGVRPEFGNGRGHDVRARVPDAFQLSHSGAFI